MTTQAKRHLAEVSTSMAQLDNLMQLDLLLPSQYFRPRRKQAPEQRLMIAVLHDALDCVVKHRFATDNEGRRLFAEAQHWFLADETDWPYSFECICAVLDLDAKAVRQRLQLSSDLPAGSLSREVWTTKRRRGATRSHVGGKGNEVKGRFEKMGADRP